MSDQMIPEAAPAGESEERDLRDLQLPLYFLGGGAMLLAFGLLAGIYIPNPQFQALSPSIVLSLGMLAVSILSLALTYTRRLQWAAATYLVALYAVALSVASIWDGLHNPIVVALLFTMIPIAGFYLERSALAALGAILFITAIGIFFAGQLGISGFGLIDFDDALVTGGALVVGVLIQDYAATRSQRLFNRLRHNTEALEERNEELTTIQGSLEQTVAERTADLERRSRYLEAIAEITRDTNAILDPDTLLQRVVTLIAQKFDFYHIGLFLIDEQREWAVMRAASSVGGQRMIARGHRLAVGKQGIVGYTTGLGRPRIAQRTDLDYVFTTAEELPETRAEMALPLKARGEVIGALDIQDTDEDAFKQEDIAILQTLADQIALAINNAELYQQAQFAVEEVRRASGESSRRSWQEALLSGRMPSYRYSRSSEAATRMQTGTLPDIEGQNIVAIPIQVRGQTIGTIDIVKEDDGDWEMSEQELLQTLSEQLGVALDSARLFDETQQRAASERLISDITTEIRQSLDIETILRNAARSIHERLELPEVSIRLLDVSSDGNGAGGANGGSQHGDGGAG